MVSSSLVFILAIKQTEPRPISLSNSRQPSGHNGLGLGGLGASLVWVDLLAILVEANTWWWGTVLAALNGTDTKRGISMFDLRSGGLRRCCEATSGSTPGQRIFSRCHIPDNLAVNSARDTVLELEVHLWDGVLWKNRGVGNIAYEGVNLYVRDVCRVLYRCEFEYF